MSDDQKFMEGPYQLIQQRDDDVRYLRKKNQNNFKNVQVLYIVYKYVYKSPPNIILSTIK